MTTIESSSLIKQFAHRLKQTMGAKQEKKKQQAHPAQFNFQNICSKVNFEQQAKDDFGNLHPQYTQPIRKGYHEVRDYVQLYTHDILNTVRQIDLLCIKTSSRNYDSYQTCKTHTNEQIRKKIYIPIVNSAALLYKVSNLCLLKGNSIDMCTKIITDHTYFMFKLAADRANLLTQPLKKLVPKQLEVPTYNIPKLNNAIDDQ